MASEDSISSSNGLIALSKKRKKKDVPNYNSLSASSVANSTSTSASNSSASNSYYRHISENLRDAQYDYLWKFICVGDCGVGKSSVLNLYKNMYFNPAECKPTPGLGLVETRVNFHRYRIHLQLWDTSGDPRFNCLTASLYRDSMAFLLMFDVASEESFQSVKVWVEHIRTHAAKNHPVIYLIGNKVDLTSSRKITSERAAALKEELKLDKYVECCVFDVQSGAPERTKVAQLFTEILTDMIESIDREIDSQTKKLISHKAFKEKFRAADKFLYQGKENTGLCCGCCSCLPLFGKFKT